MSALEQVQLRTESCMNTKHFAWYKFSIWKTTPFLDGSCFPVCFPCLEPLYGSKQDMTFHTIFINLLKEKAMISHNKYILGIKLFFLPLKKSTCTKSYSPGWLIGKLAKPMSIAILLDVNITNCKKSFPESMLGVYLLSSWYIRFFVSGVDKTDIWLMYLGLRIPLRDFPFPSTISTF